MSVFNFPLAPPKSAKNAQKRPQKAKKDQQGSKRAKEGQKGQTTAQKCYNVPESVKKLFHCDGAKIRTRQEI